ncbi:serpin family protein [Candidatus Woesearchaeota archaeon]|nr:serpin family protein [Candidatus Woesearchaeota archaeon]
MRKILAITLALVLLSVVLVGCGEEERIVVPIDDSGATPEKVASVVDSNNQFAFDLYHKYKDEYDSNIFYSPYSISTALAMTYEGARGKTAEEMQDVFHFPDEDIRRPGYARIYNEINKKDKGYKLSTANALWSQEKFGFLPDFMGTVEQYFGGRATNLNFISNPEGSRKIINDWVEENTMGKIKDLIPRGVITGMTRLVLTNAIYFKGTWVKQFEKKDTKDEDFYVDETKIIKAPTMRLTGEEAEFNYGETDELQVLELPYEGEDLSMLILLPKEDLASIDSYLAPEALNALKQSMYEQRVDIYIPKFKFETKYMMNEDLKQMGMPTAFSMAADFSGMTGDTSLYISAVIHQAFVEVNEEGTEAAAATGVVISLKSAMPTQPKVFRADHPFIFMIQQKDTGNILFMGRVNNPTE